MGEAEEVRSEPRFERCEKQNFTKSGESAPDRGHSMFKGPESGPKALENKKARQNGWGGGRKGRTPEMKLERQEESCRP